MMGFSFWGGEAALHDGECSFFLKKTSFVGCVVLMRVKVENHPGSTTSEWNRRRTQWWNCGALLLRKRHNSELRFKPFFYPFEPFANLKCAQHYGFWASYHLTSGNKKQSVNSRKLSSAGWSSKLHVRTLTASAGPSHSRSRSSFSIESCPTGTSLNTSPLRPVPHSQSVPTGQQRKLTIFCQFQDFSVIPTVFHTDFCVSSKNRCPCYVTQIFSAWFLSYQFVAQERAWLSHTCAHTRATTPTHTWLISVS